jgi:hypothetical protein
MRHRYFRILVLLAVVLCFLFYNPFSSHTPSSPFVCNLTDSLKQRYQPIIGNRYLFVLNLHQSEAILEYLSCSVIYRHLISQLILIYSFIGQGFSISIVEGGSTDLTPVLLPSYNRSCCWKTFQPCWTWKTSSNL